MDFDEAGKDKGCQAARREDGGGLTLEPLIRQKLENATYAIALRHSGVQICAWTKKALRGRGVCYKQKFYGVDCHRCCQMSPSVAWCQQSCVFCWRPMEWMKKTQMEEGEIDTPEEIIEECVAKRKKLIAGVGGAADVKESMFRQSFNEFPSHWAISLSGEPTLYPKLGELVRALRARKEVRSIFIVTNGQEPERIAKMAEDGNLPTQLYLSLTAPNEELFKKINRSMHKDGWERLNRTLELLARLDCRRVIRLTLIKRVNDGEGFIPAYAQLLEKSKADFVEVKSYMHLGQSRERLERANMPTHEEILGWAGKLAAALPQYEIINDDPPSRIALMKRKDSVFENIIRKA